MHLMHPNYCQITIMYRSQKNIKLRLTPNNYASDYINFVLSCSLYLQQAMPSSLPKVLNAVKWNQHKDVAVVSIIVVEPLQSN